MIEQLWYTWTTKGLGNSPGYQSRAASAGLRESTSRRYRAFRSYLNYYLPQGTDSSVATLQNSPVTLAFLNIDETAPAEKGRNTRIVPAEEKRNTHIVLHKVYKEEDARGRPESFFAHLIDVLPQDFLASDAIDLWGSSFWCLSEDAQPTLPDNFLKQINTTEELLPQNPDNKMNTLHYQYAQAIQRVEKELIYLIQAFLWLKPTQKLYIAGHWKKVAALIWGLTQSLPRSFQQTENLTFSTYEKKISETSARIVGTCRPSTSYDQYEQHIGKAQEILPAMVFTGSGPAFALDCDTGHHVTLPRDTEDAKMLIAYAEYAVDLLIRGQQEELTKLLKQATDNEVKNTNSFLTFIKIHIKEIAKRDWTPQDITRLLSERKDAANNLSGGNIQNSLLSHWTNPYLPEWRNEVQSLLEKLSPAADSTDKDDIKLQEAFLLLARRVLTELAENLGNDTIYSALQALLAICVLPNTKRELQLHLIKCLQRQFEKNLGFASVLYSLSWEQRDWLLQQAAGANKVQSVQDQIVAPLLPQNWIELHTFLDIKVFPTNWRKQAISYNIDTTLNAEKPIPQSSARTLLEKHNDELFSAIGDLLQQPKKQAQALQFCMQLLSLIVKRKRYWRDALSYLWHQIINVLMVVPRALRNSWRYVLSIFIQIDQPKKELLMTWKSVVIPILGIEISEPAHPINLDELLKAAQLQPEDQYFLVEQFPNLLLSPSHVVSPYVEEICGTFLDLLIDKAEELAERSHIHHFYSDKTFYALEWLRKVDFSDQRRKRHVLDLLCLMITAREELFEWYLTQDQAFLSNLAGSISRFRFSKDQMYMGNLYRLILRKTRTTDTIDVIIDQLAYLFEDERDKKRKNHPEDRRRFFAGLISYAEKKYNFQVETLPSFVQLACKYVDGLTKEKSQKEFLAPIFKKISSMRFRNVAFKVLDGKVQNTLASNEGYLKLWKKYSPDGSEQRIVLDSGTERERQQTLPDPILEQVNPYNPPIDGAGESPVGQSAASNINNDTIQATGRDSEISALQASNPISQPAGRDPSRFTNPPAATPMGSPGGQQAGFGENPAAAPTANERDNPANYNMQQAPGQQAWDAWKFADDRIAPNDSGNRGSQFKQIGNNIAANNYQAVNNEAEHPASPQPIVEFPTEDILSVVLGQMVTKKNVSGIAFAFEKYVPWRIGILTAEIKQLNDKRNKSAGEQLDKLYAERDMLEDLQSSDNYKQIKRLLENDILIISVFPQIQSVFKETFNDDYQKMKTSSEHKSITNGKNEEKNVKEGDIYYLFSICMRYCALADYLSKQGGKDIKQWLKDKRDELGLL